MTPDAATRLSGLLGHPVGHSVSPAVHDAALRHEGRNAVYLAFDVSPGEVGVAVAGLRALGAVGVNVTIPHKAQTLGAADTASPSASRTGAANTLVFGPSGVEAHNTDGTGMLGALEVLGVSPAGLVCLVLGAGGAGRSAAWALSDAGAAEVWVCNRSPRRSEELAGARVLGWEERGEAAGLAQVIVNATSVGMSGEGSPLDVESLRRAAGGGCLALLDMVYGAQETELVRTARGSGLKASDGLEMLVRQAAESYRLFWGAEPSLDVMREAAASTLGR